MDALLAFWDREPRRDPLTDLRTWHDQMESGADNCVLSRCPNARSPCWTEPQAYTLASADVITLLQREHIAFALFSEAWAAAETSGSAEATTHLAVASEHRAKADSLTASLNERLWLAPYPRFSVHDFIVWGCLFATEFGPALTQE